MLKVQRHSSALTVRCQKTMHLYIFIIFIRFIGFYTLFGSHTRADYKNLHCIFLYVPASSIKKGRSLISFDRWKE